MKERIAIGLLLVVVFLGAFALAVGTTPTGATPNDEQVSTSNTAGGFTLEGCWSYFPAGPCYDIYRDAQGDYWKCKQCNTTKNPHSGCARISQETLNAGSWCS